MFVVILLCIGIAAVISIFWVRGIDYMKNNHPDYKGKDFLNWESDITKTAGRDGWDDNLVHSEGDF